MYNTNFLDKKIIHFIDELKKINGKNDFLSLLEKNNIDKSLLQTYINKGDYYFAEFYNEKDYNILLMIKDYGINIEKLKKSCANTLNHLDLSLKDIYFKLFNSHIYEEKSIMDIVWSSICIDGNQDCFNFYKPHYFKYYSTETAILNTFNSMIQEQNIDLLPLMFKTEYENIDFHLTKEIDQIFYIKEMDNAESLLEFIIEKYNDGNEIYNNNNYYMNVINNYFECINLNEISKKSSNNIKLNKL